jgi:holo-[acyl-carrier protein] synthase
MVKGIGVDIIEVSRIRQSVETAGDRFLQKIFTPEEIKYCKSKRNMYQHFAARFAAKEAVSKAMSTGWDKEFLWKDVEVMNDPSGQPRITLHGRAEQRLADCSVLLTLSHSDSHVVAMVLIETP